MSNIRFQKVFGKSRKQFGQQKWTNKKKCAQKLKRTRNLDQWDKKWEKVNRNVLLQ